MKKLIAKRPVLYLGRMYDKGDTLPYYFTAMSLRIQAPAVHKEVPEA